MDPSGSLRRSPETVTAWLVGDPPTQKWASRVAQMVKDLPAVQETQVRSLGQEDPLEKGTATHSSVLIWRIP